MFSYTHNSDNNISPKNKSILSVIIEYELKKKNTTILLTQCEINYLDNLIKTEPQIFNSINKQIKDICNDDIIDYEEIPQIILLIAKVFKKHITQESITNINIASIVKFTIDAILYSGILPLYGMELDIIDKFINSSIELLKINLEIVKKEENLCYYIFC